MRLPDQQQKIILNQRKREIILCEDLELSELLDEWQHLQLVNLGQNAILLVALYLGSSLLER